MSEEDNNNDNEEVTGTKRDNEEATAAPEGEEPNKKIKTEDDSADKSDSALQPADDSAESHAFVLPGTVGVTQIGDNDVLSGKQPKGGVRSLSLPLLCAISGWKISACFIPFFLLIILHPILLFLVLLLHNLLFFWCLFTSQSLTNRTRRRYQSASWKPPIP